MSKKKWHTCLTCFRAVLPDKIFCRDCLDLVSPEARRNWSIAFPYDVPHATAMNPYHSDQADAIRRMRENVLFAKRQIPLFAESRKGGSTK